MQEAHAGSELALAHYLMGSLEQLRDVSGMREPLALIELLERLQNLHSDGGLSDIEFEQAKKRALGL